MSPPGAALHRSGVLDEATEGLLRPGGLELTRQALARCALPPRARVLDVGCGLGTTVADLRATLGLDAVGLDLDEVLLRKAAARSRGRLVRGDAQALPLRDGWADAVLLECVFSLVAHPDALLAECRRVLRPGGTLVLTDVYARGAAPLAPAQQACPSWARGLRPLADVGAALERHFQLRALEDCSGALKELLGRLVFAGRGLAPFWGLACAPEVEPGEAARALRAARPGYLLALAVRREEGAPS